MKAVDRLPDVLIGGAPRCGTSWLHTVFANHPKMYVPVPFKPEPKFFLVDAEYAKGLPYYSNRWFSKTPADVVACEKSTNYLESSMAACRISRDLPAARMIFILREPADRARANYLWSRQNGLETEDFATALGLEAGREATYPPEYRFSRPHSYFSRGLYARHLRPYLELLGRDRVLVMRYEDIAEDPTTFAEHVLRFLNLELGSLDVTELGKVNSGHARDGADDFDEIVRGLKERYQGPNKELHNLLGADFEFWDD